MRSHRAVDVCKGVARSVRPGATDTLFSMKPAKPVALLPEEPLASEVQALLNSATNLIECATADMDDAPTACVDAAATGRGRGQARSGA